MFVLSPQVRVSLAGLGRAGYINLDPSLNALVTSCQLLSNGNLIIEFNLLPKLNLVEPNSD